MWKMKITVILPDKDELRVFHKSEHPDIVLVHNNMKGENAHFTATGKCTLIFRNVCS